MKKTKDSQTHESSDSLQDIDMFCKVQELTALEELAISWNNLESARQVQNHCNDKFPITEAESLMQDISCNSIDDLPNVKKRENQNISKAVLEMRSDTFDLLTQTLSQSVEDWRSHSQKIHSDLQSLEQTQSSEMKSAQQMLSEIDNDIRRKELKIEEYNQKIMMEGALLFGSFILGTGLGVSGALGNGVGILGGFLALAAMFYFRCQTI